MLVLRLLCCGWPRRSVSGATGLEWRLRGGLQWPAFVLFTLLDAVVLWRLPPLAFQDLNVFDGVFMAVFGNLILLGRWRRSWPGG